MIIQVVRTRPLSEEELDTGTLAVSPKRLLMTRRAFVSGVLVIPVLGATCLLPRPTKAQDLRSRLAEVAFYGGLYILEKLIEVYLDARASTEVINKQDTPENRSLIASIRNERGLTERQGYQVIQVAPRSAAEINVIINVGGQPGDKELRVASRVDHVAGKIEVYA